MDGFGLDLWDASSEVNRDSASGLGGPGLGTSPTRMTSEGTSEGGVVFSSSQSQLFVNTTADQRECRLVKLHENAIDGSELCGGDIGRAGKHLCAARSEACLVISHKSRPAKWKPDDLSPLGLYVFISVAGTMVKLWTDSAMAFETIQPVWDRVKDEERTMADWMALFNKIKSGDLAQEELVRIVHDHAASDEALGRSAASPRHLKADDDSAVDWDALRGGNEAFTNAEQDEAGARVSGDVQDQIHELGRAVIVTRSQQRDADLRQVQLQNQVGIRSSVDGAASVHTAVTRLEDRIGLVEDTTEDVQNRVDAWNQSGDLDWIQRLRTEDSDIGGVRADLTQSMTQVTAMVARNVGPLVKFFRPYTSQEAGDVLRSTLQALGDRMNRVETDMVTLKPTGSAGRFRPPDRSGQYAASRQGEGFSLDLRGGDTTSRPSAGIARSSGIEDRDAATRLRAMEEKFASLLENYTRLQSQVKNLQEENKESNVEVAGYIFYSMDDFVACFTDEAQGPDEQVGMSDIMALLVATGIDRDTMAVGAKLKEQAESKKAGFHNSEGAYYEESFSCFCPDQFRRQADRDGGDMSRRLLTRFPKFEKFDSRAGSDAAKTVILKKVQDRVKQLIASHRTLSSRKLFDIKRDILDGSYRFLEQLFTWIAIHYRDQVDEMGAKSEKETWEYIQHSVREIFQALYEVRHYGAGRSPAEQAWYALRGYMLQEEIMAAEFTNHDIVLKVLHQHLKNNVVTKTQFAEEIANLKGLINKDPRKGKGKTTE